MLAEGFLGFNESSEPRPLIFPPALERWPSRRFEVGLLAPLDEVGRFYSSELRY
jgi:hypothetical protein